MPPRRHFFVSMRTRHYLTFILAAVLFMVPAPPRAQAQDYTSSPVNVSKDRVRGSDGKVYWSHAVLKNQTLYSIAKAYMVSVDDIYKANPSLKEEGLKAETLILVPISQKLLDSMKGEEKTASPEEGTPSPSEETTTKKATAATAIPQELTEGSDDYFVHVVKWYENFDDIAKKYGIPSAYLMKYNGMTSKKLKSRMKLKIPRYLPTETDETPSPSEGQEGVTAEGDGSSEDKGQDEETTGTKEFKAKTEAKIALLMPLGSQSATPNVNNMDFYAGVLMAVRQAAEDGFGVDLSVFDTQTSKFPVDSAALSGMDFVIGPTTVDGLRKVLAMSEDSCAVISPLDPKATALIPGHANFIQAPSPTADQLSDLVKWISEQYKEGDKVIVISESGTKALSDLDTLFKQKDIKAVDFSFSITEGRTIIGPMTELLVDEGMNHVIIRSEKEAFTFEAVRNLNLARHRKKPITLYSPSRIRNFTTIDVENLHELNLHTSMSYFVDYDDRRVKDFLPMYRSLFNAEPSQFSFQGYDLALFFLDAIKRDGNLWMDRLEGMDEQSMLQSNFRFSRIPDGGLQNLGIRRAVYTEDFRILKEK